MTRITGCGSMVCAQGRRSLGRTAVHRSTDRRRHARCRCGLTPTASGLMTVGAFAHLGCHPACVRSHEIRARTREEAPPGRAVVHRLHRACRHGLRERTGVPVRRAMAACAGVRESGRCRLRARRFSSRCGAHRGCPGRFPRRLMARPSLGTCVSPPRPPWRCGGRLPSRPLRRCAPAPGLRPRVPRAPRRPGCRCRCRRRRCARDSARRARAGCGARRARRGA